MNILITGASRGIGAAAYALLKKTGHNVVGHSTKGTDQLIAGDLVEIKKSDSTFNVIVSKDKDYFHILRSKLRWSGR